MVKRLGTMAVFTQSVTTKLLQAAKREAQKAKAAQRGLLEVEVID